MLIPDFTDEQIASVQSMLAERYGEPIETHLADGEVPAGDDQATIVNCPVLFWNAQDCNFAILRLAEDRFRAQYFYTPDEQYSTHQTEFNTITDCVTMVLRSQADHQREKQMASAN